MNKILKYHIMLIACFYTDHESLKKACFAFDILTKCSGLKVTMDKRETIGICGSPFNYKYIIFSEMIPEDLLFSI
jgi:hypothetical protein